MHEKVLGFHFLPCFSTHSVVAVEIKAIKWLHYFQVEPQGALLGNVMGMWLMP